MPAWLIVAGFATASVLRGLMAGALVLLIALPMTSLEIQHLGSGILVAVLSALLFAFAGLLNGIFARSFDDTSVIATFLLTPLIYLLGTSSTRSSVCRPLGYRFIGQPHGLHR